jgi:hypothetical protein
VIEAATDALLGARNPDGGWGAEQGKQSSTEATALAVLALGALDGRSFERDIGRGLAWLADRQTADGSWPLGADMDGGSWTTSLATISLAGFAAQRPRALRGAYWLLRQEGQRPAWWVSLLQRWVLPQGSAVRLNPNLKGWPWASGAFSWVEPTAYALIALKKLRADVAASQISERIQQGEMMIYDRMCQGGGWNYGNSNVLGVDVPPYPETTAVALVALQDRQAETANQMSLEALRGMLADVESGLALSWASLCFSIYGRDTSDLRRRLARTYEKTAFLGATRTLALAILAWKDGSNGFRV